LAGYEEQFVEYNFFMVSCIGICMVASYHTELYLRKEFLLKKESHRADLSMLLVKQHEEISKAKTRFLANVSHELRTPLHGIIGMAQALLQTKLDNEQSEISEIILNSAQALVGITNDILDISKVEQKGHEAFTLETKKLNLLKLVEDVVDVVAWKAFKKVTFNNTLLMNIRNLTLDHTFLPLCHQICMVTQLEFVRSSLTLFPTQLNSQNKAT
jgi:signal transduction histidine kinase